MRTTEPISRIDCLDHLNRSLSLLATSVFAAQREIEEQGGNPHIADGLHTSFRALEFDLSEFRLLLDEIDNGLVDHI